MSQIEKRIAPQLVGRVTEHVAELVVHAHDLVRFGIDLTLPNRRQVKQIGGFSGRWPKTLFGRRGQRLGLVDDINPQYFQ